MHVIWINQDWFAWSDMHDDTLCKYFIRSLEKKYPETKQYIEKNYFRSNKYLSSDIRTFYLHEFENIIMKHVYNHPDQLFVYDGSDIFRKTEWKL